jgi:hypothetical protein
MATIYRVTVTRETDDGYEVELELAGPAARLARYAPSAVQELLADAAGVAEREAQFEAVRVVAPAGSDAAIGAAQAEVPPPAPAKRTRRTKAQIAADEAAKAEQNGSGETAPEQPPASTPTPPEQPPAAAPPTTNGPVYNPFA